MESIPKLFEAAKNVASDDAEELLDRLKEINSKGYITDAPGDTGVGYTLETPLGIPANSSQAPDFRGIEIKSVQRSQDQTHHCFQVPNWSLQAQSSKDLLILGENTVRKRRDCSCFTNCRQLRQIPMT